MRKLTVVLGAALLGAASPGESLAQRPATAPTPALQEADIVLLGGKVFTADPARPWVEAVAIRGERIAAVGSTEEVRRLAGAKTKVYDLAGRVVVPGFNDAHMHIAAVPEGVGIPFGSAEMVPDPPFAVVLDSLAAAARRIPRGAWLGGDVGESALRSMAPRAALDRVTPDHPVILAAPTGHGLVLNSAALRELGIDDESGDPPGGWFERDASGRPNGVLHEYANLNARTRLISRRPDSVHLAAVRAINDGAIRMGITSIQDMAIFTAPALKLRAVRDAAPDVRLRVVRMPATDASGGYTEWRTAERDVPLPEGSRVRVAGLKWVLDGTPVERLAAMREPYADRPGWHGRLNFPTDSIRAMLRDALAQPPGPDRQLILHAIGDSTTAVVLRLMSELAPDSAWRARRVRIEHADALFDDLWPLARRLGVVVVVNPTHFALPELMLTRMGSARVPRFQPVRSMIAAGIPLAAGSDGPFNPFLGLMFATTHPGNPAEALSREQAVIAYTHGSAYAEFAEHEKGRLAPDMLADLAVLSQDIFTVEPQMLPGTASVLTMIGGRVVHDGGVLTAAAASSAEAADRAGSAFAVPAYTDTAQLRTAAQAIIDAFHARTVAASLDLGTAPMVEVRTTPQTVFYSGNSGKIVVAAWEELAPEVQAVFAQMADGNATEGERLFRATAHHFVIAHEAGHWLRHRSETNATTRYAREDDANRIAVAFWRTQPGGEEFLAAFERMLVDVVSRIPDPTPAGQDPGAFFDAHYMELGQDPIRYSFYQYRFVLDALRERSRLNFDTMLAGLVIRS